MFWLVRTLVVEYKVADETAVQAPLLLAAVVYGCSDLPCDRHHPVDAGRAPKRTGELHTRQNPCPAISLAAYRMTIFDEWNASAIPDSDLHSTPLSRMIALKVSSVNQCLPRCEE